eukprot:Blabericola_migrator_1__204@NODE_1054_length_5578_cov_25_802395_g596_i1_p4_GENE_NODE_1054_length_5578_cov_25_802395_g596_i1NODE_1054_length_5578_cov_25_802395_g596_i1_p4_ORF_typecomplete_len170_score19_64_NODE_1054_length_5578_cov_25_802395_g596_i188597
MGIIAEMQGARRKKVTALYVYGARLFNTRYTLLYGEGILDALKANTPETHEANTASSHPAFIAAEPGTNDPPTFEKAAAALQHHLGGAEISVKGSRGLTIQPAVLTFSSAATSNSNSVNVHLKVNGQTLCAIPSWRLVQSWRGGDFGCYEVPTESAEALIKHGDVTPIS